MTKKNKKYVEFPYLEELEDDEIEELKKVNKVYIDPGRRSLLYMMDDNGKILNYSNRKHVESTKRLKYQRLLENYKKKECIDMIERIMNKYNSKSCDYKKFKEYIENKNFINDVLMSSYSNEIFRKYKWYSFMNKKRTEDKLVNEIKKTYGQSTIVMGDWSIGKSLRGMMSTPNLGLKRKLGKHFTIYSIDEFRTSKLHCITEKETDNLVLPDKKGKLREIHSILTCQMENNRLVCINRDKNSVRNMKKITKEFLEKGTRPEKYRRNYKEVPKQQKTSTPKTKKLVKVSSVG